MFGIFDFFLNFAVSVQIWSVYGWTRYENLMENVHISDTHEIKKNTKLKINKQLTKWWEVVL